jgi:regulator of sigma E protease
MRPPGATPNAWSDDFKAQCMGEFAGSVWWLLVTLGVLVTLHEFGHFWVARRLGVRVLRFSVGFGRPLWLRRGNDGTEYTIAAIPLGGYVRMLDEREGDVPEAQRHESFNRKPVGSRIAIVAAGPIANILFAVFAFWLMFVVGKPDYLPFVGAPSGLAAEAGLREDDRLVALGGRPVNTWTDGTITLISAALERKDVALEVEAPDGGRRTLELPMSRLPPELDEREALAALGIRARAPVVPAVVGRVLDGRPAERAGLAAGDRIVSVEGRPVEHFDDLYDAIQAAAAIDPSIELGVRRDGELRTVTLTAEPGTDAQGKPNFQLGIAAPDARDTVLRYGPLDAIPAAVSETWRMTTTTASFIKHMVTGRASLENVSGPIGIARTANFSASLGLAWFLSFLAMMSLSIGILNLLPIPILDGGHLLYYLIELLKGSPVSERALVAGQYVGLAMLAGLMGLAFHNDILSLIP